jgi:hypothetical protein
MQAQMGRRISNGVAVIQANNGLTMIRLAESVEQWGCTDFSTTLTAVQRSWCSSGGGVLGRVRPAGISTGTQTALPRVSGRNRQPILQRKSFAIDEFPSKRKPGSRDVPGSDPSTNTPPARGSRSCAWCSTLIIQMDRACAKKIKAI